MKMEIGLPVFWQEKRFLEKFKSLVGFPRGF
jgi:hypothetical protein